jgi:hypothetical protein
MQSPWHHISVGGIISQRFACFSTLPEFIQVPSGRDGSKSVTLELPQAEQVLYLFISRHVE